MEYLPLLPARSFEIDDTLFRALLGVITAPPGEGSLDADYIGRAKLSESQLKELAAVFEGLGSAKAARLLAAFESNTSATIATQLLGALQKSKAVSAINPDTIRRAFAKCPDDIRARVDDVITASTPNGAQQRARLDALATELPKGDVRRGHQVFRSTKSTCTTCHAMAYVGGTLGPDLTKIGGTRTERDLLEAIVFPSASFVRSYESAFVKTKTGEQLGILKKDAADEVILATGPGTEARIPRGDVVDIQPAPVSLMPPGMDGILTPSEIADLVAFLRAQK
jgi:putative heme-binding domain-containing protein